MYTGERFHSFCLKESKKSAHKVHRIYLVRIRNDLGAEFTASNVRSWVEKLQIKLLFIGPATPWENGFIELFNGKMRYELLHGEIFYILKEAQVLSETWRMEYNIARPHSALGSQPPVPKAIMIPTT